MVEAVQYIVIVMTVSNNMRNHVKTMVRDSGIIPVSDQSTVRKVKHDYETAIDNTVRIGDVWYTTVNDGVSYKVHRYEYVARVPYQS